MTASNFRLARLAGPILFVCLLAAAPSGLLAEEAAEAEAERLDLRTAILLALDNNLGLAVERYAPQIAREQVTIARSEFEPTLTGTVRSRVSQQSSAASTLDGAAGPRSEVSDARIGVSQKIDTGAVVSVSTGMVRQETNSTFSTLNPAYDADVSLSVRQPLLQGFGAAVNRANRQRAEIGVDRADYLFDAEVLNVVLNTELAYYRLVFAREQLTVRRLGLQLAERLLEEARIRRETGVATSLDVLQAEVGVANQRSALLLAEQAVSDAEDALLALIGQFDFDRAIGTVEALLPEPVRPDVEASFRRARDRQPEFLATLALVDQLELDLVAARNGRLPSLSLNGALGYSGRDGTSRGAWGEIPDREGYNWQVDLALSVPWGMREGRARLRQAEASLEREEMRLRRIEQDILVEVRSRVRAVETAMERVQIAALATSLSEREYELELARFENGLSTSRLVLDSQRALDEARVSELQVGIDLQEAIARLHRLEGTSLERFTIANR